jgi:PAS domain S-box-containing protein
MRRNPHHELNSEETRISLDSIADGVFTINTDFRITSFNRAAEEITGVSREDAISKRCQEVFRADICETDCALKRTIKSGVPVIDRPIYIIKADGRRVPISISSATLRDKNGRIIGGVETFRDLSVVKELRKRLEGRYTFSDILSQNARMSDIFAILPEIAESNSTVLIEGESGTGKELLARAIHNLSRRRRKPMVVVNCGAIPDSLLESELFGYEAGAFTDAKKNKPGRFAVAEGGTVFLDEIGDISAALQVRLLRVIQERTYEPLGSTHAVTTDVRIIAATNKDFEGEVAAGRFRKDLYFRINVIRITPPPLRDRKEDIPLLAQHFIERMNRLRGRKLEGLSDDALTTFMQYDWPGNIRELENTIEHAFVLCHKGRIETQHLPVALRARGETQAPISQGRSLAEIEAGVIYETLVRHHWKPVAAARELGIDKTTLWRKMKRLELKAPHQD